MKKLIQSISLLCLMVLASAAMAQTTGAAMSVDSDVIDYGTIANGSDGAREFTITNTGTDDLLISNCKGSCGCTVPECPKEPIKPGESAVIKVKYDTKRTGTFSKQVTVMSNDATTPTKILRIKGIVEPPAPAGNE